MGQNISPARFALLLAALPAYGQFEGVLEMKIVQRTALNN